MEWVRTGIQDMENLTVPSTGAAKKGKAAENGHKTGVCLVSHTSPRLFLSLSLACKSDTKIIIIIPPLLLLRGGWFVVVVVVRQPLSCCVESGRPFSDGGNGRGTWPRFPKLGRISFSPLLRLKLPSLPLYTRNTETVASSLAPN